MSVSSPFHPQYMLDSQTLYKEFEKYLLTEVQLEANGFPRESVYHPGRIFISTNSNFGNQSCERQCVRCNQVYHVFSDFSYSSKTLCRYHPRKMDIRSGKYPCCNAQDGCRTVQCHVSPESNLYGVQFKQTKNTGCSTSYNVFGLDCEMVYTTAGLEVAKVGIVDIEGKTVFESFVLPQYFILDYNTTYSGITAEDLQLHGQPFSEVQKGILKVLNKDSILVGHGLDNDLRALRLIHHKVVDTSVVFPHKRAEYKKSLKNLAKEFLNKNIQTYFKGHNCIEDAYTCIELMHLKIGSELNKKPPSSVMQDENNLNLINTSVPVLQSTTFHSNGYDPYDLTDASLNSENFYSNIYSSNRQCLNLPMPVEHPMSIETEPCYENVQTYNTYNSINNAFDFSDDIHQNSLQPVWETVPACGYFSPTVFQPLWEPPLIHGEITY